MGEKFYPRIATMSKDFYLRIWSHQNQEHYNDKYARNEEKVNKCGYNQILAH